MLSFFCFLEIPENFHNMEDYSQPKAFQPCFKFFCSSVSVLEADSASMTQTVSVRQKSLATFANCQVFSIDLHPDEKNTEKIQS